MADLERLLKEQETEDQKVPYLWSNICTFLFHPHIFLQGCIIECNAFRQLFDFHKSLSS